MMLHSSHSFLASVERSEVIRILAFNWLHHWFSFVVALLHFRISV
jgi:hypothetical protein